MNLQRGVYTHLYVWEVVEYIEIRLALSIAYRETCGYNIYIYDWSIRRKDEPVVGIIPFCAELLLT